MNKRGELHWTYFFGAAMFLLLLGVVAFAIIRPTASVGNKVNIEIVENEFRACMAKYAFTEYTGGKKIDLDDDDVPDQCDWCLNRNTLDEDIADNGLQPSCFPAKLVQDLYGHVDEICENNKDLRVRANVVWLEPGKRVPGLPANEENPVISTGRCVVTPKTPTGG